ncbi:DUF5684 domain-containing protein [Geomonas sp. RF6]|uniref:DUF5684 domain-containing protein n=1 Tax=Geomonas sp. RF6 TaxID=2897342 RepID=UPI001E5E15AA|nr:DUF5684 domain-containing protein [Geomonas sp. RF6]UFS71238.1 DUF5684 domain-containing protein [Geomonas sp. RF6]
MHFLRGTVLVGVWLLLVGICSGKEVYFKDGSTVECESFWRSESTVFVKVNRDILLRFERSEIDIKRTFGKIPTKKSGAVAPVGQVRRPQSLQRPAATPMPAQGASAAARAAKPAAPAAAPSLPLPTEGAQSLPARPTPAPSTASELNAPQDASPPPQPRPAGNVLPAGLQPGAATLLIFVGCIVLAVASMWRIFEKAGQSGVSSLIPIYNLFIFMEISGKPWWWLILLFIPVVGVIIGIVANVSLASKFRKGPAFGLGLAFLPMLFLPLLAFSSAEYEP